MNEIYELLKEMNMPISYHHFTKATPPPFLIYYRISSNNFIADNIVYEKTNIIRIELYTKIKDINIENALETILTNHEIPYEVVAENYIESENIYQVIYEIEI